MPVIARRYRKKHYHSIGTAMCKTFLAAFCLIPFLLSAPACAEQIDDCRAAHKSQNFQAELKLCTPLADKGDARAQLYVGELSRYGRGVKQDFAEAMKWFRKSADQGNAVAQDYVGTLYEQGWSVKKDWAEAAKWFRKAAEQGLPDAQFNLSDLYLGGGNGLKADYAEGYFWAGLTVKAHFHDAGFLAGDAANHLTPEEKAAIEKRVEEWLKDHPAPGFDKWL